MQKIEYNGETYYYINTKFVDSSFIEVNKTIKDKLSDIVFTKEYKSMGKDELIAYVKEVKESDVYYLASEICEYCVLIYSNDVEVVRTILPIATSCYRKIGRPKDAINLVQQFPKIYHKYGSVALLTSLAAAYCDIGDYINAKKYAKMAYARQGGGTGAKTELSLVFMRIKKEDGDINV